MRRRTCHGPSRAGERPSGTSSWRNATCTPPCPRRRASTTTTTASASTRCPALCTGSLASPFTVSGGESAAGPDWTKLDFFFFVLMFYCKTQKCHFFSLYLLEPCIRGTDHSLMTTSRRRLAHCRQDRECGGCHLSANLRCQAVLQIVGFET